MRTLTLLMVFFLLAIQIQTEPHQRRAEAVLNQVQLGEDDQDTSILEGMKVLLFKIQINEVSMLEIEQRRSMEMSSEIRLAMGA